MYRKKVRKFQVRREQVRTEYIVDWYMYTVLLQARDLIYTAYESLVVT